jgi:hypothetical protein
MGSINLNLLFASMVWGSVATGYLVYGQRQKSLPAFVGGLAMGAVSYFASGVWSMSAMSLAIMAGVYYLYRRGA